MLELTDIETVAPGVTNLTPKEHEALQRFTLIWTLFEAQVLDNNASVSKIAEIVTKADIHADELVWFKEQLGYFKERYIENGETNYRFDHLHLRKNDNPDRVRSVLLGEIDETSEQLISCLTIVYRFRNNYFHGVKWAYGMQEQLDNFTHSSRLLLKCMERMP
jgi:hypothetical protein